MLPTAPAATARTGAADIAAAASVAQKPAHSAGGVVAADGGDDAVSADAVA